LDSSYPAAGEVQQPLFVQDTATGT
jgi:hypothetical protein